MNVGSQEFIDMQNSFEKSFRKMPVASGRLDRASRANVPVSVFYEDGRVNELFYAFMYGYQLARCVYLNG